MLRGNIAAKAGGPTNSSATKQESYGAFSTQILLKGVQYQGSDKSDKADQAAEAQIVLYTCSCVHYAMCIPVPLKSGGMEAQ